MILPLDQSLIPNQVNLGTELVEPGLRPGQRALDAVHVVDDRHRLDTPRGQGGATSWKALWDERWKGHIAMLDDQREVFAAGAHPARLPAEHGRRRQLDAASPCSSSSSRSSALYTSRTQQYMASGDIWMPGMSGAGSGRSTTRSSGRSRRSSSYIPEEGAVRGSDAMVILDGAKHPVAAQPVHQLHLLDAHVSAANSNYIGYMGPNEAAKAVHRPGPPRPRPDQPGQGRRRQAPGAARTWASTPTSTPRAGPS